jgi:hypothetical protein
MTLFPDYQTSCPHHLEDKIEIPSHVHGIGQPGVCKVHFGNQADDHTVATEPTDHTSQPDLIDYINDHLGVDFDTL